MGRLYYTAEELAAARKKGVTIFVHADVTGGHIREEDFQGCEFLDVSFNHTTFIRVNFCGVNFAGCTWNRATFTSCNLRKTVIRDCAAFFSYFRGSNFCRAVLRRVTFRSTSLEDCSFNLGRILDSHFLTAPLMRCDFSNTEINQVTVDTQVESCTFKKSKVSRGNFMEVGFAGNMLLNSAFTSCNFYGAIWCGHSISQVNFTDSNFTRSDLGDIDFIGCDLLRADFSGAYLQKTEFIDCNLEKTILSPEAKCNNPTTNQLLTDGFKINGGWIYGYRTKRSQHVGYTVYEVGKTYTAPIFSNCEKTDCHPGLYVAGPTWLHASYPIAAIAYSKVPYVKVRFRREDCIKAGDKFRVKKFTVVEDVKLLVDF